MASRGRMPRRHSRHNFRRASAVHPMNDRHSVIRGGWRL
jgi:hypothetical protein